MAAKEGRADFWAGLFWIVFGGAILAQSIMMPIPSHLGATVLTGPGLVPGALGAGLILLGAILILRVMRAAVIESPEGAVDPETVSVWRPLIACGLMVLYAWGLVERLPFVVLTIVFVSVFVIAFNWEDRSWADRAKTVAGALVVATATGFLLEFVFEGLFYVRLP